MEVVWQLLLQFRLLRSLIKAIVFAILPQQFMTHTPGVTPKGGVHDAYILFCDTAPRGEGLQIFHGYILASHGLVPMALPSLGHVTSASQIDGRRSVCVSAYSVSTLA